MPELFTETNHEPAANSAAFPRVLIISPNVLNSEHGGGVTMSHLFAGWPRENLAQIHADRNISPNHEISASYYLLPSRISANPIEWLPRTLEYARGRTESLDGVASVRVTPALRRWLKEFQPEIVFSQMGGLWLTRLTNIVVRELRIPLAVHVSDDWICDWPVNGLDQRNIFPLTQLLNRWCRIEFVRALQAARLRFCISQAMCQEYARRYGLEFSKLHNGVDPKQWRAKEIKPAGAGAPFRILYSGSITENGNLRSLEEIAGAVNALASSGVNLRMEIATHSTGFAFRQRLERPPWVTFCDLVPYADLPQRLQEFDLLVVALNFDNESSRWLRYSMLGKLAEYMISGTPILLHGPPTATSIEYAVSGKWGYAVTTPGQEHLQTALRRLIDDVDLRRELASAAREVAERDQDITRMRADFQKAVCQTVFPST